MLLCFLSSFLEIQMRSSFFPVGLSFAFSLVSSPALAGAGVSPFLAVVSPDNLPRSVQLSYDFTGIDAVYVMSTADAEQVDWRGYVWGPHGEPLVGSVPGDLAADEVVAITETGFLTGTIFAVADDAFLQELVDSALVGPCGAEPVMMGLVQGDLIASHITSFLPGLSDQEPAVGTVDYGLNTEPVPDLSSRRTGTTGPFYPTIG